MVTEDIRMRVPILIALLFAASALCQDLPPTQPGLKQRTDLPASPGQPPQDPAGLWVVPAGTRIPIQLRQAVSTRNAQPGDPIYAQTTFPVVANNVIMIPAGTYVKGVVDSSKRAGRIKGRAELQFHLTTLIYANGYTLELAAAVDQVPGNSSAHMKEPGTVTRDPDKAGDLRKIGDAAATAGQIGATAGAVSGGLRGIGLGGLGGIAAGTLIAILARGSDVQFDIGSGVEVALNRAIGIDGAQVMRAGVSASSVPSPVITPVRAGTTEK
jgi:type IV secretion system protein VirB10